VFLCSSVAFAAKAFGGANTLFAQGLSPSDRLAYVQHLSEANVKVLRVYISEAHSGAKGITFPSYPDLEPVQVGIYNDTVLYLIDDLMISARMFGIKLLISFHDVFSLLANDSYAGRFGTKGFYENPEAIFAFENRLKHILSHNHRSLGVPWRLLHEYIIGFEPQNAPMWGFEDEYITAHQAWNCDRSNTVRALLGDSPIQIVSGGLNSFDKNFQPLWLECPGIDVIGIHAFNDTISFNVDSLKSRVSQALQHNKKLLYTEWGACNYLNENNNLCPQGFGSTLPSAIRNQNLQFWSHNISSAGIPWVYFGIVPTNNWAEDWDYDIGVQDRSWEAFKSISNGALQFESPFTFDIL